MTVVTLLRVLFTSIAMATFGYPSELAERCTGTISSLDGVAAAVACTTVNINAFMVPAGSSFILNLLNGTTVNLNGNIQFGNKSWAGPLLQLNGNNIMFNGNGHTLDGGGPFYWDGQGSGGGSLKPRPMLKVKISGTISNLHVVNSPAQTFSVSNPGPLTIKNVTIDNSQGDLPNAKSGGAPAGHNTDGFDVGTTDLTIQNCVVKNQDDCVAINEGRNIVFEGNNCSGGHGISIGSVDGGVTVSGIMIVGNTVTKNDQALRIKTEADATNSTVSNVTYSGNIGSGLRRFGVLIDQSYPSTVGTPGTGVKLSNINFVGATNTLSVASSATPVAVNCGVGACSGTWSWSSLKTSGGVSNFFFNSPVLSGFDHD